MFEQFGNLAELMKNAGKIRESMEKAGEVLGQLRVEGTAGGGAVTVQVNGRLEVLAVRIDPKLLTENDRELLEEFLVAAFNDALNRARETAAQSLSSQLPIPPGMANLFGR